MNYLRFVISPLFFALVLFWPSVSFAQGGTPPTVLVEENVQSIDVEGAKVWWSFVSPCAPTAATVAADANQQTRVEDINRIPAVGGLTRTIYSHDVRSFFCGDWSPEILSNVVYDADYAYWMSNEYDGLVKLSVAANDGDEPTLIYSGQSNADAIVERGDYVWLMDDAYGTIRVHKETGADQQITTVTQLGGPARDLQVDEDFIYWNQNGFLKFQTAQRRSWFRHCPERDRLCAGLLPLLPYSLHGRYCSSGPE